MNEPPGARLRAPHRHSRWPSVIARGSHKTPTGPTTLLFIDKSSVFSQAGSRVFPLFLGRMPSNVVSNRRSPPYGRLQSGSRPRARAHHASVQAVYVPADDLIGADPRASHDVCFLSTRSSRASARSLRRGIFLPAVDPWHPTSAFLSTPQTSPDTPTFARRSSSILQRIPYREHSATQLIAILGVDSSRKTTSSSPTAPA